MEKIWIIAIIDATVIYLASRLLLRLYGRAVDIGRQEISYQVIARRTHGLGTILKRYVYILYGKCRGKDVETVLTEEEYQRLKGGSGSTTYVYVRQYPSKWLNPRFSEYDISVSEPDWKERDRKSVFKGFLFLLIVTEFILFCIYYEL